MANPTQPSTEFETIATLFRHNLWANTRLFDLCAGLSDEQLDASIIGAYGSIRDTLRHVANGERAYLAFVTTREPYRRLAARPALAELQASIRESGAGLVAAAPTIQPGDMGQVVWGDSPPEKVPSAIILTQAINHATEHRAQIMATLTQLGMEPPELSGWAYFEAPDR